VTQNALFASMLQAIEKLNERIDKQDELLGAVKIFIRPEEEFSNRLYALNLRVCYLESSLSIADREEAE
jgi:hypothetical protein